MAPTALKSPPVKGSPPPPVLLRAGDYLTDESSLFRCVSTGPAHDPAATALLEDCMTLDLLVLPFGELDSSRLRLVRPAA